MKRIVFLLLIILLGTTPRLRADEGMWLPLLLKNQNYEDMKRMGLRLTAEQLYDINTSSVKDAIIIFGRGCTGEIISPQGLVLTNHHCGFGQIQYHSTVEHDYLTDGFWANSLKEELPNPGLTAKLLIRIEDVTKRVLDSLTPGITEQERTVKIASVKKSLEKEATQGTHYDATMSTFFSGNEYYLFIYETYKDVRLVGAPPSSIGKFGYDTDNWMWPRHTGDFSIFRIYTGPDGKPAEYSPENLPLQPKHHLPIAMDGIQENDFSFIMGYPGTTQRYLTSHGIEQNLNTVLPTRIDIRRKKLDIMNEGMMADPAVRIQYASKYARTSNYWKNFIGMSRGLKRLHVYDKKKALEDQFEAWLRNNPDKAAKYSEAIPLISKGYKGREKYNLAFYYYVEAIASGSEIIPLTRSFDALIKELEAEQPDQAKIKSLSETLKTDLAKYFKDYNAAVDQKLFAAMMEMFSKNVPAEFQPEYLKKANSKYKGNFSQMAADFFAASMLDNKDKLMAWIDKPSVKTLEKDPAFVAASAFYGRFDEIRKEMAAADDDLNKGYRLFTAGLREMNPDKKYYPDANSTMRLTYGQVLDYYPADAVHYDFRTTLKGVMEKEDTGNYEFRVPAKLKDLYAKKDFGPYGENGTMYVCFTTNHDITGGNSGSPVLNGNGELIGLAFDGNWEAMSGDIAFEPELQRTINVDIRYVLFIIDKFAGAQRLINEMTILPASVRPPAQTRDVRDVEMMRQE